MSVNNQLTLSVQLPDDETFESYRGNTNEQAIHSIKNLLDDKQAKLKVNVCYLFGRTGVGKSHLLHAACAYAQSKDMSSLCLSLKELEHLSVELLVGLESFDLVCLDDIHLLAERPDWQQAVFDLFNRMTEQQKVLIISGDSAVNELDLSLPDLRSRLSWGLVEQLKPLSDKDKVQAIHYRAQQRGLLLSEEVTKFLMVRISRDMNNLISVLDQLDKASIREQRKITVPFIKQVLLD